jgi:hypothetical protein
VPNARCPRWPAGVVELVKARGLTCEKSYHHEGSHSRGEMFSIHRCARTEYTNAVATSRIYGLIGPGRVQGSVLPMSPPLNQAPGRLSERYARRVLCHYQQKRETPSGRRAAGLNPFGTMMMKQPPEPSLAGRCTRYTGSRSA